MYLYAKFHAKIHSIFLRVGKKYKDRHTDRQTCFVIYNIDSLAKTYLRIYLRRVCSFIDRACSEYQQSLLSLLAWLCVGGGGGRLKYLPVR